LILPACGQQTFGSGHRDGHLNNNAVELCTFVTAVEHFFAGQKDFLEIGAVALRAGHVHLVTPCSPTSVWEESVLVNFPCPLS
jgi:hypothetical protein